MDHHASRCRARGRRHESGHGSWAVGRGLLAGDALSAARRQPARLRASPCVLGALSRRTASDRWLRLSGTSSSRAVSNSACESEFGFKHLERGYSGACRAVIDVRRSRARAVFFPADAAHECNGAV